VHSPASGAASWRERVANHFAAPPESVRGLGGDCWQVVIRDREQVVVKTGAGVIDEGRGLELLAAQVGAPPVPEVLLVEPGLLVTRFVRSGTRSQSGEEELGRSLARLHDAPWQEWGGGSSFIGMCEVDPAPHNSAAGFYGARLIALANRCGLSGPVRAVANRLECLLPDGGPGLLHGDLWWGNVLWGEDGRAWLIDPSVHGGHPEEDLAMLALFGTVPARLIGAYAEQRPLDPGWSERTELFQLYPLLVHAVLFGGGYRARAEAIARRYG
jgi:fructosamine-3-kinase